MQISSRADRIDYPSSIPLKTQFGAAAIDVVSGSRFDVRVDAGEVYETRGGVSALLSYVRPTDDPWIWRLVSQQVWRTNDRAGLGKPVCDKTVARVVGRLDGSIRRMLRSRPPWLAQIQRIEIENALHESRARIGLLEEQLATERARLVALEAIRP